MVASFAAQAAIALELAARRADAEQLTVFEDRDRIARDLHDLVIQRLYATGMSLQGTLPMVARPEVADRIRNAIDAMDDTIRDIRATIFSLQARGKQAGSGLRAEIFMLVDEMTAMLGFAPTLRLGGGLDTRVSGDAAEQSLAVLREALSNAARHARASQVWVTVDISQGEPAPVLTVAVRDNGRGIPEGGRRSGLRNLAERAEKLGGQLRISAPADGGGTELEWQVPLPPELPEAEDEHASPPPQGRYPLR
jgi:signal transduction histidine kinase